MSILSFVTVTLILMGGCSSDSSSPNVDAMPAVAMDSRGQAADGAAVADVCYPTGIYGKCGLGCSNCLRGASIYSVCSSSCTTNGDCGSADDFAGASPLCAPLNPGSQSRICVLTCQTTAECPCGLECRESGVAGVKICAQTL